MTRFARLFPAVVLAFVVAAGCVQAPDNVIGPVAPAVTISGAHGLVVGTLSWWIGRIRRLDREAIGAPAARRASAFLPVKIVSSPQAPAIAEPVGRHHVEIALRDGDVVRVPVGIDAAWAGLLVAAMRGGARC